MFGKHHASSEPSAAASEGTKRSKRLRCSFCRKSADEVSQLIAGPKVYICDGCVAICVAIFAEEPPKRPELAPSHPN